MGKDWELTGGRRTLMHLCEGTGGVFMPLPDIDAWLQSLKEVA